MSSLAAAACGLLAAGAALGAAELAAALSKPQTGPLLAVGSAFIDLTPAWLKDFAIRTFGGNDKNVLLLALVIVVAAFAAAIGLAARRHPRLAGGGLISLGLVAAAAALSRPGSAPLDVLPSLLAAVVGASALHLTRRAWLRTFAPAAADHGWASGSAAIGPMTDRRALLRTAATVLGVAAVTGGLGRVVSATRDAAVAGVRLVLPRPADPAPPLPVGSDLRLPGLGSFTTANKDFYRVDTALVVPRVPHQDWVLRIHGLVDRPVELTFDDILAPAAGGAGHHHDVRVQRGRRPLRRPRAMARRRPGRPAPPGRGTGGRRPDPVAIGGRLDLRHPGAGRTGRPGRTAGRRHER